MKKVIWLLECLYLLETADLYRQEAMAKRNELRMDPQRTYLQSEIDNGLDRYRGLEVQYQQCLQREDQQRRK